MLTGDKLETAENIGESCKLIKKGMKEKLIVRGVKETVKAVRKGGKG